MARRQIRPKKRGPRPQGPFEDKRRTLSTRITDETRTKLEGAREATGRSLSQEIEFRLDASFRDDGHLTETFGGVVPLKLMRALAGFAAVTSKVRDKDWLRDQSVFDDVISQWYVALVQLRPGVKFAGSQTHGILWNLPDAIKNMPSDGAFDVLTRLAEEVKDKSLRSTLEESVEDSERGAYYKSES